MKNILLMLTVSLALAPASVLAQDDAECRRPVSVAQLMTPDEVVATGLQALTASQLQALSAWVDSYRRDIEAKALSAPEDEYGPEGLVIDTQILGDFDGWVGDTVFRLKNGQIWQQTSPSAKYLTSREPRVRITRRPFVMHVDGIATEIEVKRVK